MKKPIFQILQVLSGVSVTGIGVYMMFSFEAGAAPFFSGIAFAILGLNVWLKNCILIHGCAGGECKK